MNKGQLSLENNSSNKLVIVGAGEFAEIAYEYFTHDSPYTVAAFAVEKEFLIKTSLYDLPVVPLEELADTYPAAQFSIFVAVTYTKLNTVRERLYGHLKEQGYRFASYVSSRAFVWHNVTLGDNVFIYENNVVQHRATIGDNVVLWSGNHIGHQSVIEDHCYLASHVVVSGYCRIGANSFVGVNATFADHVTVGRDCLIGAGALILADVPEDTIVPGVASKPATVSSRRFHRVGKR
jgi:sugar O-acyltransferase (sialic acid O-acetyltransferase NeuD family)